MNCNFGLLLINAKHRRFIHLRTESIKSVGKGDLYKRQDLLKKIFKFNR